MHVNTDAKGGHPILLQNFIFCFKFFWNYPIVLCSFPKIFQFKLYFLVFWWNIYNQILYHQPNWKHVTSPNSKRQHVVLELCALLHWAAESRIGIGMSTFGFPIKQILSLHCFDCYRYYSFDTSLMTSKKGNRECCLITITAVTHRTMQKKQNLNSSDN